MYLRSLTFQLLDPYGEHSARQLELARSQPTSFSRATALTHKVNPLVLRGADLTQRRSVPGDQAQQASRIGLKFPHTTRREGKTDS